VNLFKRREKKMIEEKHVQCLRCFKNCGIIATVEEGRVTAVRGDPDSMTGGSICPKCTLSAIEELYHPDRVNYPLKRVGAKGEGKWARISWDQALDEITEKLKAIRAEFGPEALVLTSCHGESSHEAIAAYGRFGNLFGTPNNNYGGTFV